MAELPDDVVKIKQALSCEPSDELAEIAEKLILEDSPELAAMWRTLERRTYRQSPRPHHPALGDPWVQQFLWQAADASTLPPFHYKPAKERRDLSNSIVGLATRLARALEVNGLDAHLIHNNGKLFNGFYLYEEFSEHNRASIDAAGTNKLKVSVLIKEIAERARQKIAVEPMPGKAGVNARAIRFVRIMAERNNQMYDSPLNAVTAAAANAIFGTCYVESDIRKLLSR